MLIISMKVTVRASPLGFAAPYNVNVFSCGVYST